MSTKGASNRYGNSRHGRQGKSTQHIGFAWAKDFNKKTLYDHFRRRGEQVGTSTKENYAAHAVRFANREDRENVRSFVDGKGSTYKFNVKSNEFAIVSKRWLCYNIFQAYKGI